MVYFRDQIDNSRYLSTALPQTGSLCRVAGCRIAPDKPTRHPTVHLSVTQPSTLILSSAIPPVTTSVWGPFEKMFCGSILRSIPAQVNKPAVNCLTTGIKKQPQLTCNIRCPHHGFGAILPVHITGSGKIRCLHNGMSAILPVRFLGSS